MSLRELRTPIKTRFDNGYDWAMEEYAKGTKLELIAQVNDLRFDFDRGVDAAIKDIEKQLKDEFI